MAHYWRRRCILYYTSSPHRFTVGAAIFGLENSTAASISRQTFVFRPMSICHAGRPDQVQWPHKLISFVNGSKDHGPWPLEITGVGATHCHGLLDLTDCKRIHENSNSTFCKHFRRRLALRATAFDKNGRIHSTLTDWATGFWLILCADAKSLQSSKIPKMPICIGSSRIANVLRLVLFCHSLITVDVRSEQIIGSIVSNPIKWHGYQSIWMLTAGWIEVIGNSKHCPRRAQLACNAVYLPFTWRIWRKHQIQTSHSRLGGEHHSRMANHMSIAYNLEKFLID